MKIKLPILMTASVSTRGMKGAAFSDSEREKMYLEALKVYIDLLLARDPARRIVFAENSGWDLETFRSQLPGDYLGQIEFIGLNPLDFDINRGKGYNEILLINQTIERSAVIKKAGAFMKVTGRYPVYNLGRYLEESEEFFSRGGRYYGDMKDHKVFDVLFPHNTAKWNGHAAYTVLFATTLDFYANHLAESYSLCNDYTNDWIECVWYRLLKDYRFQMNGGVQLRLPVEPVCGGMQGSTAQTIAFSRSNESAKALLLRFVGNCIRRLTPNFWF